MLLDWGIAIVVFVLIRTSSCTYECTMKSFEVTCIRIKPSELAGKVSVILNKTDITRLEIRNSSVPTLTTSMLPEFNNLQYLDITDSLIENIEPDAFKTNVHLKEVNLGDNMLKAFNGDLVLSQNNKLTTLDLSNNQLSDFKWTNISHFTKFKVLNLTNNLLKSLPEGILEKLVETEEFYVIIDGNPWDCNDTTWSDKLDSKMVEAFCLNNTFNYVPKLKRDSFIQSVVKSEIYSDKTNLLNRINRLDPKYISCKKCGYMFSVSLFVCGLWFGIIIGNIGTLKKLCARQKHFRSVSVQCDHSVVENYVKSGVYLDVIRPTPTPSEQE
ncbi:hypothetical protein GWI33_020502 [Rhynchophorus ferrugineus]|uniref:Uncharacterized protein n=1 Tax=Rhynchophorus ferrugineus TaxID=354439 RepID=A0A834HPB7_RHYFE|nr:hypothetical protein GWI33_020502 [Rhynchophorus ferrugineus]